MTQQNTKRLVESALMIALGTILSSDALKFGGIWAFGGGVTACSMVTLVIISYRWGNRWGCFTAFVYSLLQLMFGIDNVQYATGIGMAIAIILLDYVLAYTVIGFSAMFKNRVKNIYVGIILGVVVTLGLRFVCHFLTGWMIWDALWPNELGMTSVIYSICYNGSYMLPEIIITAAGGCLIIPWAEKHIKK